MVQACRSLSATSFRYALPSVQGFGNGAYPYWIGHGDNGQLDIETVTYDPVRNISKAYISTPNVKREAREHFACPTLPGGETENDGGVGSARGGTELGGHWDARVWSVRAGNSMSLNNKYTCHCSALTWRPRIDHILGHLLTFACS